MFISVLDLFKLGIGPSSSHTVGPMIAALGFREAIQNQTLTAQTPLKVRCTLKGSLAFTGKGHATDRAIVLGLHGYAPDSLTETDVDALTQSLWNKPLNIGQHAFDFSPDKDIVFDLGLPLPQHPNGMIFELINVDDHIIFSQTIFSIGGGFIANLEEIDKTVAPLKMEHRDTSPYPFDSAKAMLARALESQMSIAEMKRQNELKELTPEQLDQGLDNIWQAMQHCIETGLNTTGVLPGKLNVQRRAKNLYQQLKTHEGTVDVSEWLCAYAMAVNEENAAGHAVVTAPTNGAAGVIPAVLYYFIKHDGGSIEQARDFLLTAAAIGGLIKHRSSISGAEVGCQGEVGSAAAMAAAGLCAAKGGNAQQIENAAEIALEHHLGLTCDPVAGLVQVPCIERNGFGAIKAFTATSLALRGSGEHFMPLDSCIQAMKETGEEMSHRYKETSLGGLAVSITEC
ncbi:MAG: L-serine ammonia-lyase [Arenicellales bacterium]